MQTKPITLFHCLSIDMRTPDIVKDVEWKKSSTHFFGLASDIYNCAQIVSRQQQVKDNEAVGNRDIHVPAEPSTTKQ